MHPEMRFGRRSWHGIKMEKQNDSKKTLLVSACLLGEPTKYDGGSNPTPEVMRLGERYELVSVCPEVLGGLPTPRTPSERVDGRVFMRDGREVSENFRVGAERAYDIFCKRGCVAAILKARSPSCGKGRVYDGSFSGRLTDGDGVFAELLLNRGVSVFTEEDVKNS